MNPLEVRTIGSFLDEFGTLTLATHGPAGPWAASLFFTRDAQLNLYFISDVNCRHVKNLLEVRKVAVTVNTDHKVWTDIRGLQIAATAEPLACDKRPKVEECYLKKFKGLRQVLSAPANSEEQKISEKFLASSFYCIRPTTIRIIDNSKGFGYTREFVVGAQSAGNQ